MEIVITHTIHADVIALLKSFIAPNGGGQVAPVKETAAVPAKSSKGAKAAAPVVQEPVAETTPAANPQAQEPEVDFTALRKLYLKKKDEGKQEKVKPILAEYGADRLSAVKPENMKEVYDKINEL